MLGLQVAVACLCQIAKRHWLLRGMVFSKSVDVYSNCQAFSCKLSLHTGCVLLQTLPHALLSG